MAINRAQLEQQIQSLSNGGGIAPMDDDLQSVVDQAAAVDTNELRSQFGMPSKEQELLEEMQRKFAPAPRQSIGIDMPDFDESFSKYQTQLRNVYGQRSRPNFYDLASTVGGAMLAADPTAGAFRSAGMGLAQFGKEQAALREQRLQEDRAIGLKAFEMAKSDVDSARNLLNEYALLRAKENADNKVTEMIVTDPNGISVGGVFYEKGERPLLTEGEIYAYRNGVAEVASPIGGVKVPDAGAVAIYQTRADAEQTILGLGMRRESPYFDQAVNQLVPTDPSLVGKRIISGGRYTELRPYVVGDEVFNIMLNTAQGETTPFKEYADKRLGIIAKNNDAFADKAMTVLPEVERALQTLTSLKNQGVDTGVITNALLPFESAFKQIFGTDEPTVAQLESLVGISNLLATKIRPVGSGSTSDMEFAAYRRAILDLGNTPEANFIALYVYKKMTRNAIEYNRVEQEALTSGDFTNAKQVNDKIKELDTGIFVKFPGDANDEEAIRAFLKTVPKGEVVLNRDSNGVPLVEGEGPYLIQGFGKTFGE